MSEVLLFCDPGRVGYRAYVEGNAPALAGADVFEQAPTAANGVRKRAGY